MNLLVKRFHEAVDNNIRFWAELRLELSNAERKFIEKYQIEKRVSMREPNIWKTLYSGDTYTTVDFRKTEAANQAIDTIKTMLSGIEQYAASIGSWDGEDEPIYYPLIDPADELQDS